jgi:hypothetical protein
LFLELEDRFNKRVVLGELEEKKKILAELREIRKPINFEAIEEH